MRLGLALIAVVVIVALSTLNWRRSLKLMLVVLILEGALRKWILPQASELIYFLKDFFVLGAYIHYYGISTAWKPSFKNTGINILLFLNMGWCAFQVFNPSLGSVLIGLFGAKAYLFYIPLIWLLPELFRSPDELYQFLRHYLLWTIPVGLLGIVQFFSPADSPINAYAPGDVTSIATFGSEGAVRVTGTFSYISGYGVYLLVCFGLLIVLLSVSQTRLWRSLTLIELLMVVGNGFMTGSRGVILGMVLFLLGYVVLRFLSYPAEVLPLIKRFTLPVIVITIAALIWFRPAITAFSERTSGNQDIPNRIVQTFVEPIQMAQYKNFDGYGVGATHPGSNALRRLFQLPGGEPIAAPYFEPELGRVMLELGPLGFVFWYGLRLAIAASLLRLAWTLKSLFLSRLALTAFLIHAIQIIGQMVFNHTFSVYFWFLSGFMLMLPHLERIQDWQQSAQTQRYVQSPYFYYPPDGQSELP